MCDLLSLFCDLGNLFYEIFSLFWTHKADLVCFKGAFSENSALLCWS